MSDGMAPVTYAPSENADIRSLIETACTALRAAEADLNALDAKSGDGDTGSTVATAARALSDALDDLPLADTQQLLRAIGSTLGRSMGGSSGVILAIFFAAAGDAASGGDVVGALKAGLTRVQEVGGAAPGDRTMIDALLPALDALPDGLSAAAKAARTGADATASITNARAGRATYVSASNLEGHNDPGAEAVALLFERLAAG